MVDGEKRSEGQREKEGKEGRKEREEEKVLIVLESNKRVISEY